MEDWNNFDSYCKRSYSIDVSYDGEEKIPRMS